MSFAAGPAEQARTGDHGEPGRTKRPDPSGDYTRQDLRSVTANWGQGRMAQIAIWSAAGPDPGRLGLANELNARLSVLALLLPSSSSIPTALFPAGHFSPAIFCLCTSAVLMLQLGRTGNATASVV